MLEKHRLATSYFEFAFFFARFFDKILCFLASTISLSVEPDDEFPGDDLAIWDATYPVDSKCSGLSRAMDLALIVGNFLA